MKRNEKREVFGSEKIFAEKLRNFGPTFVFPGFGFLISFSDRSETNRKIDFYSNLPFSE